MVLSRVFIFKLSELFENASVFISIRMQIDFCFVFCFFFVKYFSYRLICGKSFYVFNSIKTILINLNMRIKCRGQNGKTQFFKLLNGYVLTSSNYCLSVHSMEIIYFLNELKCIDYCPLFLSHFLFFAWRFFNFQFIKFDNNWLKWNQWIVC